MFSNLRNTEAHQHANATACSILQHILHADSRSATSAMRILWYVAVFRRRIGLQQFSLRYLNRLDLAWSPSVTSGDCLCIRLSQSRLGYFVLCHLQELSCWSARPVASSTLNPQS